MERFLAWRCCERLLLGDGAGGSFGLDENTGFGPSFGADVTRLGGFDASFVLTLPTERL